MHDVDHVRRGVDVEDLDGGVALERGGGDSASAAGVVEDEGASVGRMEVTIWVAMARVARPMRRL